MTSTAHEDQFLPHPDDVAQAQPKRRPYNASASLSEYGIFPECDAAEAPANGADVVLPPCPKALVYRDMMPCFMWPEMQDYARAAVLADRQQRGGDVKHIADDTRVGILADSSYINGLRHGYMLGQEGNEAEYQQILGATRQQVIEARATLAATRGESNG